MRGHIVKRYKNSYTIVLNLGNDPATGKRKQQWVSVKGTKRDAEKRLAELVHQMDTGSYVKPTKSTVGEYLQTWLVDYASPNLTPRAFERYESIVTKYLVPDLGSIPLTQLRPQDLQRHYTAKLATLSPRTVKYHHTVLHVALETALKWGMVARNVACAVDPPPASHTDMQTWNEDEIARFLEGARDTEYYALFYLALFTGARRSELLALRWQDVDLLFGQVQISRGLHHLKDGSYVFSQPKSAKSRRAIALPPSAVMVLRDHRDKLLTVGDLADDDLVFCHLDGSPLRPNSVSRAWVRLAAGCGVKTIRLHDARHTHATLMLKQGIHPKIVQERLGHSSIAVTLDTYSHIIPGLQDAAARQFDEAFTAHRTETLVEKVG